MLAFLIPISLLLGLVGLVAFLWLLRNDQFEDPQGEANRVLSNRYEKRPAPPPRHDGDTRPGKDPEERSG